MTYRIVVCLNSRYQVKENIYITKIVLICGSIQLTVTLFHEVANSVRRAYVNSIEKILYRELAVFSYVRGSFRVEDTAISS